MSGKHWENQYRTTLVYVDSFTEGVPAGRLRNPGVEGETAFYGVLDFLRKMEALLDLLGCPQSFTARRSFVPPAEPALGRDAPAGEVRAAFELRVMFRRNASWQGSVTWLRDGRREDFRSVLELLLLLDGALRSLENHGANPRAR